jgi:large subunit ribosomal protein L10
MALTKEKKKEIYATLSDAIKKNPSVVFVNFHKLNVAGATELRRALRASGVGYVVAKKTLIKKAFTDAGVVTGEMPALDGEVALAYSTDLIAPAREIYAFQKKFDGAVSLLGGVFEGTYQTKEQSVVLASIPPLKTLYAQFANLINSPIQGFVMALDQIAKGKEKSGADQAQAMPQQVATQTVSA